jgi:membrane fusion protein, multidrug efflux system
MIVNRHKNFVATGLKAAALAFLLLMPTTVNAGEFAVKIGQITDLKAVFAKVEPVDVALARTRIGGTITKLSVDEGSQVRKGQRLAVVADPKLSLGITAMDARIKSLEARLNLARADLKRSRKLRKSGSLSQARLDQAISNHEVVVSEIAAARAERAVLVQNQAEGVVLAPSAGRVLKVNVTAGTVVMPGEAIARIAAESYILRLHLPERHARFLRQGDTALVGGRGLAVTDSGVRKGHIRQVYPKLEQGLVIADVSVEGLGDFFVGERVRVWMPAGKRPAMIIPKSYLYKRFGVSFVRLQDGTEVAVQEGAETREGIEILAGLRANDLLVAP